ncbi:hypothetical protein K2F43_05955 [Clostridium estertheticum]|uniref:hypothetical protein n=1 Tax=Clostridium estertheticum TaxID=238834 RepID=UPI001C6DF253|nr:hypothetical protein [Clostridium estertheticum]MBW9170749.1 hypothetical protein [Clostridium estertheticum]WLC74411.1 hypothetical protein KTC99_16795 [Clostridium estertheticum]
MELLVLIIIASMFLGKSKGRKYKKGNSILSTLTLIGTTIYQLLQILITTIQLTIIFFTPSFKLIIKCINKLYRYLQDKKKESVPQEPIPSISSNIIPFAKRSIL